LSFAGCGDGNWSEQRMQGEWLEFEKPLVEIEREIRDLRGATGDGAVAADKQIASLERKAEKLRHKLFNNLSPWERVQLARHPRRPYTLDYIKHLFTDFEELHGDRFFGDDAAIISGLARFDGDPIAIVGHQKGRNTKQNIKRNFGMPHPEGYRKALRVMKLAEKFDCPIITFVDTPGAYPGIGAEERGQAEAVAMGIREMSRLRVPVLVFVTGEGGSGGALAIAVGDRVFILEYAFYSVISPEGCASILWKTRDMATQAAEALKFTAPDLLRLGVVDELIPEPPGGAHRAPKAMAATMADVIRRSLSELQPLTPEQRVERRQNRFLSMGAIVE
jgi:acetyl-CoA carboxylase carboxyl transferase subunit alpha